MGKKYLKISILFISLAIAVFGVIFGIKLPFSSAAQVQVQLFVPSPTCGNGIQEGDAEQCDDGNINNADGCDQYCFFEVCGNGRIQYGEQCDDGNANNNDLCTNTCRNAFCGDSITRAGAEQCDDGNTINVDACTNSCMNAVCGDTFLRAGVEQCDDGNIVSNDGCNNMCVIEFCGDNLVQTGLGEQCDDGNTVNGDSCDSQCYNEVCGNGRVQSGELCDDGNTVNTDGCTSACAVEVGYVCSGTTPSCCSLCGDSLVRCAEQCDNGKQCVDGITTCVTDAQCFGIGNGICAVRSGDGCDLVCRNEGGGTRPPAQDVVITQVTAYPELRFGAPGSNYDTRYTFSVLTPDNQTHQSLYSEPVLNPTQNSGNGYPYVTIAGLVAGTYDVTLKTTAHLTTMLDNVYLLAGENKLNFTNPANLPQIGSVVLTAGDIDNAGTSPGTLGDDVINAVDISVLLQNLGTPDTSGNNVRANLNQDAIVDGVDLNILLNNLDKEANY